MSDFKDANSVLSRAGLAAWLQDKEADLKRDVVAWLPAELSAEDRQWIIDTLIPETLGPIDTAIEYAAPAGEAAKPEAEKEEPANGEAQEKEENAPEAPDELGEERPVHDPTAQNLLDRLLYKGVLPRYAFPTDVAAFHVFDAESSTTFRPAFQFTPSQGLPAALSQYAPGKEVWINNKLWRSGALYSPMRRDLSRAWNARRYYYECQYCHYACTTELTEGSRGEIKDCEACGQHNTFGPARYWLRPPGFGREGREAEIYLYDTLPGGAGFAQRVDGLGLAVFEEALRILESCPDNCDRSCYRCLRSYKNKFEHDLLDRHIGASLLRFLLRDEAPLMSSDRLNRSTQLLFEDLERQGVEGLTLERDAGLNVAGLGTIQSPILATSPSGTQFVIGVHGPLTPDMPPTNDIAQLQEFSSSVPVVLVDELVIRKNLPRATSDLLKKLV